MANIIQPFINGKGYEWSDITVNVMGVPLAGITAIEYGETQDMTNIYAAGRFVNSRGYGKIEPSAKMTLLMAEVSNIMAVAPFGRLQDIPEFDIVVAYLDISLIPRIHKLRNVRFKNVPFGSATGDTSIEVELELILSHIEWQ